MKPFRKTVTKNGKKITVRTWSIRYRNSEGKRQEEHGFLTEEEGWYRLKEAKKEVEAERLGIRDPHHKSYRKPLVEHLDDFRKSMEDSGTSQGQVNLVTGRVRRSLEGCGFDFPMDFCPLALKGYLARLRKSGTSEQTTMHYLRAVKQFALFLFRNKRIKENPFDGLKVKKDVEKRHPRRSLSPQELGKLLEVTRGLGPMRGISGHDRMMLYLMAVRTGLRASELASLTPDDLDLDDEHPGLTLDGSRTKNGKEAKLPLSPSLAETLRQWVQGKPRNVVSVR